MTPDIMAQIGALASSVNVPLVIVLLAIGAICKHCLKKVDNDLIPVIMLISGIVFAVLIHIPFNVQTDILSVLVEGILAGAGAVGLHSQGKTVWYFFGTKDAQTEEVVAETVQDEPNK